ncbi:Fe-S cluster assembly sulfur transfer protein SufU [Pediococcus pentosaceus]|uniref:Fe-S cluster assembly sulfur transfer protein SufU n=1 Tax=Pediococcus pentosaceus TaxID=1255 RepID=UPI000C06BD91|nr:SUF system NifU family Fe-S cluster assembly protein [Pediococcus pentosaceus]
MSNIQELYQKIIVNHAKYPIGQGVLPQYNYHAKLKNPDCGDDIEVYLKVVDQHLEQISFTGQGCIISQASASMMVDALSGKRILEAQQLMQNFQNLILGKDYDESQLGDLIAFATLNQFPTRVRCGMLAWHAMTDGLNQGGVSFGK